ncbi:DUF2628 domain-containing protein [Rufibacter sp. XAAS-G3-1]|uniref:DUF2628 domain-containing protein n=1 Tax=Rufibacter sp. XAAS-G3-1 TaxID=2729134 RepID=UPI0015E78CE9|nr:DUF2628 domain-containing protein [Rufibacter sp. XAAS-G3-1]
MMSPAEETPAQEDQEEYYRAYFGTDADYYLRKLALYRAGTKITFNIGAFFFGLFWMLYRKMYVPAFFLMLALLLQSFLLGQAIQYYGITDVKAVLLNNTATVAWSVLVGFLGNWLYLRQAQAKVERALQEKQTEQQVVNTLSTQGGFTLIPHILVAALILGSLLFNQW